MTALTMAIARSAALGLGHLPGPVREHLAGKTVRCQRCGAEGVELYHDAKGVTGNLVTDRCGEVLRRAKR